MLTFHHCQIKAETKYRKPQVIPGEFLESGKNSTVVFDLVGKAFNQMTFFINKSTTGFTLFAAATRRNDRLNGLVL
jgi:hypothetical protein